MRMWDCVGGGVLWSDGVVFAAHQDAIFMSHIGATGVGLLPLADGCACVQTR